MFSLKRHFSFVYAQQVLSYHLKEVPYSTQRWRDISPVGGGNHRQMAERRVQC